MQPTFAYSAMKVATTDHAPTKLKATDYPKSRIFDIKFRLFRNADGRLTKINSRHTPLFLQISFFQIGF